MESEINLEGIKGRIFQTKDGWNSYRDISIEEMDWLVEQAEKVELLERKLENAIFTTYEDPIPKKTFPITMNVTYGGKLPIGPERE